MSSPTGTQDVDLRSIWHGLRRSMVALLVLTATAGGVTFIALNLIASRYEADAQLTITAQPTSPYPKDDPRAAATVSPRLDREAINTHVKALMAPDLLLDVAKSLGLAERAEFNRLLGPVDTFDAIMRFAGVGVPSSRLSVRERVHAAMRENLTVSAARESRYITIRFRSTDPQLAADIANSIAETYRRNLRAIPVKETNDAVEALLPKIKKLSQEVLEAEAAAKRYRAETDQLTGGKEAPTLQEQRLTSLNRELVSAEGELTEARARLAAARDLTVNGDADTLPEVQKSQVIQSLIAERVRVERQVNEARAVLLPAHPRMRQLNADLAGLRRSINRQISKVIAGIEKDVHVATVRTDQMRRQVAEMTKEAVKTSDQAAQLKSLETIANSKRNELERLQKQLEDNRTIIDTNRVPVESTIVSKARPSLSAVYPKRVSFTLLVMAATLMLGLALVIVRELLASGRPVAHNRRAGDRVDRRARAERGVRSSPLVDPPVQPGSAAERDRISRPNIVPLDDGAASEESVAEAESSDEREAEGGALAEFAAYLASMTPQEGGFRTLVTGETADIDPSDEAIEIASELGDDGHGVAIVDWSVSGDRLLGEIEIGNAASLSDLLAGRAQFDEVIVALPDTNVQYLYADGSADGILDDGERLNLVLDSLDEAYAHVIVLSRRDDAEKLFEAIEGRIDAGLLVGEPPFDEATSADGGNVFLGFEVTDIEVVRFDRATGEAFTIIEARLDSATEPA